MSALIVRIYQWMRSHRAFSALSFLLLTVLLCIAVSGQTYKEDISDFLPLNNKYHKALRVYQDISGANRILAIFQYKDTTQTDPDTLVAAIDKFVALVGRDSVVSDLTYQIDLEKVSEVSGFVYRNIPYFLTAADYQRFDSLLSDAKYIPTQIANDKQMLMFPVAGLFSQNFQRDPLNLFTPVVAQLQRRWSNVSYENYDGYIFSPDMQRAIVIMTSPYGSSETEQNAALLAQLELYAAETQHSLSVVSIHFTGGPVIAVGNASQIKSDSILAVLLAIVLIVALLFFVFHNIWNLLLIILSIGWGWLFAMGVLALIRGQVSVIVIGISSVILGIAVNYPLHLIAHLQHTPNVKSALKEIVMPLVVGNITTVGAFLALVPLESVALRDLGLFSSLLLVGTILFVLLYLPHMVNHGVRHPSTIKDSTVVQASVIQRISEVSLENKRWLVYIVLLLTIVLGYFSLKTSFDADITHINYMTDEQKQDMAYFAQLTSATAVYVVSSDSLLDTALDKSLQLQPLFQRLKSQGLLSDINSCSPMLCSTKEQAGRLERWHAFIQTYGDMLQQRVSDAARQEGFAPETFEAFYQLLGSTFEPQPTEHFTPLTSTVFATNLSVDHANHHVIDVLKVSPDHLSEVMSVVQSWGQVVFDVSSINTSIATRLSDDFNYIGWACALIVFCFLWFSLGSIELALLSFLPMAVSWLWILGIMVLCGIQFNVVNIILATFIFGQGDDYTIFITEGCQYEFAYRRKMLASYKSSIIISALIMFIGIGTLIFAKHPALHSLAEVTVIGMFSVVLMAWLLPPLVFRWLVADSRGYRRRPITIASLLGLRRRDDSVSLVRDIYRYKGVEISSAVNRSLSRHKQAPEWMSVSEPTSDNPVIITNTGWGELPLLLALRNPDINIIAIEPDEERRIVAIHAAAQVAPNLSYQPEEL